MTYRELLDEFNLRRAKNTLAREDVDLLLWAIQQLIEKMRDEEQSKVQQYRRPNMPYWKDR